MRCPLWENSPDDEPASCQRLERERDRSFCCTVPAATKTIYCDSERRYRLIQHYGHREDKCSRTECPGSSAAWPRECSMRTTSPYGFRTRRLCRERTNSVRHRPTCCIGLFQRGELRSSFDVAATGHLRRCGAAPGDGAASPRPDLSGVSVLIASGKFDTTVLLPTPPNWRQC